MGRGGRSDSIPGPFTPISGVGSEHILLKDILKIQVNRKAAEGAKNDPQSRWSRAAFIASRLRDGDAAKEIQDDFEISAAPGDLIEKAKLKTKILETQHWLELIDG